MWHSLAQSLVVGTDLIRTVGLRRRAVELPAVVPGRGRNRPNSYGGIETIRRRDKYVVTPLSRNRPNSYGGIETRQGESRRQGSIRGVGTDLIRTVGLRLLLLP